MAEKKANPAAGQKKTPKAPALYHLYSRNEGVLTPVGEATAKTATQAATTFLAKPPKEQESFAKSVKDGKAVVVVIPERNHTEIGAQEEVKRKLKLQIVK